MSIDYISAVCDGSSELFIFTPAIISERRVTSDQRRITHRGCQLQQHIYTLYAKRYPLILPSPVGCATCLHTRNLLSRLLVRSLSPLRCTLNANYRSLSDSQFPRTIFVFGCSAPKLSSKISSALRYIFSASSNRPVS